jgi:AraC family transcriptional regulator
MASTQLAKSVARASRPASVPAFSEAAAWQAIGDGWRPLHGNFQQLGVSFEWHDFHCAKPVDWARSFHPDSLEVCLNITGNGRVACQARSVDFAPLTAGFYRQGRMPLTASRKRAERHQFLTIEFSRSFLKDHVQGARDIHPLVQSVIEAGGGDSGVATPVRLNSDLQQLAASLRRPPVLASAQPLWYRCKALEVAVAFFFHVADGEELFCMRQKRLARDRVSRVIALLQQRLVNPPTLEEIGREVGCSPFHLSRTFSAEMAMTIPQYIRQLRMEKAAELLRAGTHNVTESALEVGYSSLSHFSQAFHETFGCCPGLYPFATPTQKWRKADGPPR